MAGTTNAETFPLAQIPEDLKTREFGEHGEPDDGVAYLEVTPPEEIEQATEEAGGLTRWRPAKALEKLRNQVNAAFPNRKKTSDGMIGDEAHCPGTSDHCPLISDGGIGVVAAFDMTHDPASGCDAQKIVEAIIESRDSRIKYIIWNRTIWNSSQIDEQAPWTPRAYGGSNPHTKHAHFSVLKLQAQYDSTAEWTISQG